MTQTELGKVLGVSYQQIGKYEHGTNRIAATDYAKLMTHLHGKLAMELGEQPTAPYEPPPVTRAVAQKSIDKLSEIADEVRNLAALWQRQLDEM